MRILKNGRLKTIKNNLEPGYSTSVKTDFFTTIELLN